MKGHDSYVGEQGNLLNKLEVRACLSWSNSTIRSQLHEKAMKGNGLCPAYLTGLLNSFLLCLTLFEPLFNFDNGIHLIKFLVLSIKYVYLLTDCTYINECTIYILRLY